MFVGLLLTVRLTCATDATTDDWLSQRGTPGGAASASCPAIQTDLQDWTFQGRPKQVYEQGVPAWASAAFAQVEGHPLLFIGGADQTLYALDLASRRRVWSKITNGSIVDAPVVARVLGRQVVFWGSSDRFVYAHAASNGQMLWTRELTPATATQAQAHIPSPFWSDGVLYVTCFIHDKSLTSNQQEAWLFALDAATGRVCWRQELAHGPVNAPIGCRVDGELRLFVAARKGLLQAFRTSPQGASLAWSFQMPHEVMGTPAIWPGDHPKIFLGSKFGDLICLDAKTGWKLWRRMTGNWIDNNPCCVQVDGQPTVFVGSNDYSLYALRAEDGGVLWRCPLGGEVYSAPCFFSAHQRSCVAVACLDDHLYIVDASTGDIVTSFYTGRPAWDKIAKGETLWGSPIAISIGDKTALAHGSYDGTVYLLPLDGQSRFVARTQGNIGLWIGLGVVGLLFITVVLPGVLFFSKTQIENTRCDK